MASKTPRFVLSARVNGPSSSAAVFQVFSAAVAGLVRPGSCWRIEVAGLQSQAATLGNNLSIEVRANGSLLATDVVSTGTTAQTDRGWSASFLVRFGALATAVRSRSLMIVRGQTAGGRTLEGTLSSAPNDITVSVANSQVDAACSASVVDCAIYEDASQYIDIALPPLVFNGATSLVNWGAYGQLTLPISSAAVAPALGTADTIAHTRLPTASGADYASRYFFNPFNARAVGVEPSTLPYPKNATIFYVPISGNGRSSASGSIACQVREQLTLGSNATGWTMPGTHEHSGLVQPTRFGEPVAEDSGPSQMVICQFRALESSVVPFALHVAAEAGATTVSIFGRVRHDPNNVPLSAGPYAGTTQHDGDAVLKVARGAKFGYRVRVVDGVATLEIATGNLTGSAWPYGADKVQQLMAWDYAPQWAAGYSFQFRTGLQLFDTADKFQGAGELVYHRLSSVHAAPVMWRAPASVYPLGGFDLTLPVAVVGAGPPRTFTASGVYVSDAAAVVSASTNAPLSAYGSEFFYLDNADAIVFVAPSNGATTTPQPPNTANTNPRSSNSEHTRSELVERYSGPGAQGSDWDSGIGGRFVGQCIVDACAANSGQVTFAQIHGQGSPPFVLMVWRKSSNRVEAKVYRSRADTSSANAVTYIVKTGVLLGDTIAYDIRYAGDKLVIIVNGAATTLQGDYAEGEGPQLATGWAGTPVRFSAGAYHSPDTGVGNVDNRDNPAGDKTQVRYEQFSIVHPYAHP
ncbi:MAG: hypothetical protein C0434_17710 [Xanthomonadaceae bacterium]|nr:hypothetical protein [Xanthomonadaceae bacterium]